MSRVLGYGGLANTNGARDFSSKGASIDVGYRFRANSNVLNRRRYGGLWTILCLILMK